MSKGVYTLEKPTVEIPLEEQIGKIWNKPLQKLPVYKDLPRLAGRISIESYSKPNINKQRTSVINPTIIPTTTTTTTNNNNNSEDKKKKNSKCLTLKLSQYFDEKDKLEVDKLEVQPDQQSNDTKVWKRVKNVIYQLSLVFNSEEDSRNIRDIMEAIKQPPSEYEMTLESLFKQWHNGNTEAVEQNRAIKILKLIHQNIIYIGCYEIKMRIPFLLQHMTKDVRGPEGWQIRINEGKDTVTVTHSRQEESLATAPSDKQFLFEWQLHIILNKELTEITSTNLKIVNLQFKETTSPQFKDEINRKLCSGHLFVL